ncbi:DUF935 domain-containing protein [Phaeobacter sp. 11ANDIMAR09]|uniref:DUF935 domain-containing protein n=1 Tax=Phaeobacter sp. 11ANDIMAR09 TaxID=1225647 RepID=UPI0006C88A49|nr:DUF935 domain-containing protein [Phaeobacter sp. 11ANDIMAR09]KPD10874.1 hypothetical protein AN476_18650 [Phaeobacter sp. 11ANDIMAR09]
MAKSRVLDPSGRPVEHSALTREVAEASIGTVRSPIFGYPADGLDPLLLGSILRSADHGDPIRYMGLAETLEERSPQYMAVLGNRKRAVSQLEITVEPAGEDKAALLQSTALENWLQRDELTFEIINILDAISKGYSFTEIIWDFSEGQYEPNRLEWRDQRWFRFDRRDLRTPLLLEDSGAEVPLPPYKFIYAPFPSKSGLEIRSGLARVASWCWMFSAFTQRDWAIFTQTYGQPIRLGKYGPGASDEEKNKLFRAVAGIAGDCAAIIPQSMSMEFVSSDNISGSIDLYEKRADWYDKQISKIVLGQTATTDAETGGLGSGKEHGDVREDIERADGKMLAAILNRTLVRPYIDLNYGPQKLYPKLKITRPEPEDLAAWTQATSPWFAAGLEFVEKDIRDKLSLSTPQKGDAILRKSGDQVEKLAEVDDKSDKKPSETEFKGGFKGLKGNSGGVDAAQAVEAPQGGSVAISPIGSLTERLEAEALPEMHKILSGVEAIVEGSGSLEELRENLLSAFPALPGAELPGVMAAAILAASAGGRAMVEEEADG